MEDEQPRDVPPGEAGDYTGLKALLIEDSMIIAMDTEDCLREIGVGEVRIEGTVAGALNALAASTPDLALLDYNLGKETGDAIAAELARLGVPFWLATGDSELENRLAELGARGVLIKPYGKRELAQLLAGISGPA